jgi:hypothetical protein
MATVNFTRFDQGSGTDPSDFTAYDVGSCIPFGIQSKLGIMKSTVDTSKTGITNTNADVYEAIYLKAGMKVLDAWFIVTNAETGTDKAAATFALGVTSGTVNGFVTAATCAATGVHAPNGTYLAAGGYFATSENTIDLLVASGEFEDCIVDVYALVLDCNA